MAAGTITAGSYIQQALPGFNVEFVQLTTAANGEDGVTFASNISKIKEAFVTGNEDAHGGPFTASWSGSTVTVKALAGTPGDDTVVSLMVVGF